MATSSSSSSSSSPAGARSVTLRKLENGTYVAGRAQGHRLRLEVVETVNVDPDLFVFQRSEATGAGGRAIDEFSNVASPADLDEYPADEPDEGGIFFRLRDVDLVFRSRELLDAAYTGVVEDVQALVGALNGLDALSDGETVEIDKAYREDIVCLEG